MALSSVASAQRGQGPDFAAEVRPLLAERCFTCHGPDEAAREARLRLDTFDGATAVRRGGPAVVPGAPAASALLARVGADDPFDVMPPPEAGDPLTSAEQDLLRRWIEAGADYVTHWAFVPPRAAVLPAGRHPVDHFVGAALAERGLVPAPRADRRSLLRRLHLDLTGLPPDSKQLARFEADERPGALERVVDRLLDSPHFGERWAAVWLDLARYADTKGYERDRRRDVWPWRDWVVTAFNEDLPYDEFLLAQMAGDLQPDASEESRLATAFHRNTLSNDESGTDDEEFRVAAVQDRVETTMQAVMGLTLTCARCHDHKYDPFTTREYYGLYAFLDQTADADRSDERPVMRYVFPPARPALENLDDEVADLQARIAALVERSDYVDPGFDPALVPASEPDRFVWLDEQLPAAAEVGASLTPGVGLDGSAGVEASATDLGQRHLQGIDPPLTLRWDGEFFVHVWIDPGQPTSELLVQLHEPGRGWVHGAFWGDDLIPYGELGTPERLERGPLPRPGRWARLAVPLDELDLGPGRVVDGITLSQFGGHVVWDALGFLSEGAPLPVAESQAAWELVSRRRRLELDDPLAQAALGLPAAARTAAQARALRSAYLRRAHGPTGDALEPLERQLAEAQDLLAQVSLLAPRVPVLEEVDEPRTTRVLAGGSFLSPGEVVTPHVPAALHPFPEGQPRDRLGLARWLVADDNPLTARVLVNRVWARLFGRGLVVTEEDFGTRGALPSHPELLDHLAVGFVRDGQSLKGLLRTLVTSRAYQRASTVDARTRAADPDNVWLARSSRHRLEAEMVRDSALVVSGLLSRFQGGPPVFPYQPEGLWQVVYSGADWVLSDGRDRYRRALYTFLRRTTPYPSLEALDQPPRDVCRARRQLTNTPLQSLVTLNDPAYVACAQALARRMLGEPPADAGALDRLRFGLRQALARPADPAELKILAGLLRSEVERLAADPAAAEALACDPLGPLPDGLDPVQAGAYTTVANVLLNTDEFLCRP